jgi:tetratricopeptide (TPR) repeat protein
MIGAGARLLAEEFAAAGYRTGAFIGCALLSRKAGFGRGFDKYDDDFSSEDESASGPLAERRAGVVAASARRWIIAQAGHSWFAWVHFYDPHVPYDPPEPFRTRFRAQPYDGEIAYVDRTLGDLLTAIRGSLRSNRLVILVTGDHGESLGEHGEDEHGFFAYDATLRVPLIVWADSGDPRHRIAAAHVVSEQVRSVDIMPTVLALTGLGIPSGLDGESLTPLLEGGYRRDVPASYAETCYAQRHFGWAPLRVVRIPGWKFIDAPRSELYDLARDPGERRNLASERPAQVRSLKAKLDSHSQLPGRTEAQASGQPDAETLARLRSLGYIGETVPRAEGANGDPKDHIGEYEQFVSVFRDGMALLRAQPSLAAAKFARAAAISPNNFEAHAFEGRALLEVGDFRGALEAFEASAARNPRYLDAHLGEAMACVGLKQVDRARQAVGTAISLDGHSYDARFTAGLVEERLGNLQRASTLYAEAITLEPRDPRGHANLAGVALKLGRLDDARREYEALVALHYRVAGAEFDLGVIAERQGDVKRALVHYRRALARDPSLKPAAEALRRLAASDTSVQKEPRP